MRRSTIILLIIFILLGALVWFMQQPGNPIKTALATSTVKASESTQTLINPTSGPINLISIQSADGKNITIDKTSGQWIVKTDHDQPADQGLAESAAGQALNLRIIKAFDTPPDPVGTGLEKRFIISRFYCRTVSCLVSKSATQPLPEVVIIPKRQTEK